MKRFIAIVDALWHPKNAERELLKENGLYVYDMRSWDTGCGNTLEPRVIVNYVGSVVTNFEITDWDIDDEHGKCINDMFMWEEQNDILTKHNDMEIEAKVKAILNY